MNLGWSEAARRNQSPIAEVLDEVFAQRPAWRVLEIGSGTGQHAAFFGQRYHHIQWQTSDLLANHAVIHEVIEGIATVLPPLDIDARSLAQLDRFYDVVFTANTLHIMSWQDVKHLFTNVGRLLNANGLLLVYGPFNVGGRPTSDSNYRFDQYLRLHHPQQGVRNREDVVWLAEKARLSLVQWFSMPANNQTLLFKKRR